MTTPLHPKCGQRFPGGKRAGHCGKCCRTFIGLQAFDEHLVITDSHPIHLDPAEATDTKGQPKPYWQDERGYWHYGDRMTDEQKERIRG